MPEFTNLDKDAKALDDYLLEKSYVEGYTPSQADVAVYEQFKSAPAAKYVNATRWYNHLSSYTAAEFKAFPGTKPAAKAASPAKTAPAAKPAAKPAAEEEDDDDLDLFGSDDEEDEENERIKAERVAEYNRKKAAGKPRPDAKSMIIFDVKPWDDETDMKVLTDGVLAIKKEGLLWGTSKLVPIGYGIKKLTITAVVVDELIGTDDIIDEITEGLADYVQSVDIVAFNKL
ncbi:Translation elongation factor 1 beta [Terramyces sp. JEL0728]|nr:Translation elongation factor 1 beta [Terramyces sp. JEL0728]